MTDAPDDKPMNVGNDPIRLGKLIWSFLSGNSEEKKQPENIDPKKDVVDTVGEETKEE